MARDVDIGTPTIVGIKEVYEKVDTEIAAIKAQTDDLANGERLDLLIDAIKAKTDLIT
jgi:predicted alpha/beta hydrolase